MKIVQLREMQSQDWEEVKTIYENGISTGIATFETMAPDWETWNRAHLIFAKIVALKDHRIVGWVALSPVSNRCVYEGVAEISIYVADNHRGQGIGKQLLESVITESERNGIWTLQAGIFADNTASIQLHKHSGFRIIGYREKIGRLGGKWKDNVIMEKRSKLVGVG